MEGRITTTDGAMITDGATAIIITIMGGVSQEGTDGIIVIIIIITMVGAMRMDGVTQIAQTITITIITATMAGVSRTVATMGGAQM